MVGGGGLRAWTYNRIGWNALPSNETTTKQTRSTITLAPTHGLTDGCSSSAAACGSRVAALSRNAAQSVLLRSLAYHKAVLPNCYRGGEREVGEEGDV